MAIFVRSSLLEYGVNVYNDGRVVFKSLRCPRDRAAHAKIIPMSSVAALRAAFRAAALASYEECGAPLNDSEKDLFAFYDDNEERIVLTYWAKPYIASLRQLGDTIDATVGTGEWMGSGPR
jgi:hypothetical protein